MHIFFDPYVSRFHETIKDKQKKEEKKKKDETDRFKK